MPLRATSSASSGARLFSPTGESLQSYRAYRRLHAVNGRFDKEAWIDAWTELKDGRFTYDIVSERGSAVVCDRVLRPMLATEEKIVNAGERGRGELTDENYDFEDAGVSADGLPLVQLKPRRHDVLLVDGQMVLSSDGRDLLRVEGRLAKNPSFWTSFVNVIEHFSRIDGVRVPIATESVAKIRFAGTAHLDVLYEYQNINGRPVSEAENLTAARGVGR